MAQICAATNGDAQCYGRLSLLFSSARAPNLCGGAWLVRVFPAAPLRPTVIRQIAIGRRSAVGLINSEKKEKKRALFIACADDTTSASSRPRNPFFC